MGAEQKLTEKEYLELVQPYRDCLNNMIARLQTLTLDYRAVYETEPIHHIQERIKNKNSIEGKLFAKEMEVTSENAKNYLCDIAGIRVICYFERDIYHIISVLKKQKDLDIIKETDYIKDPKVNGYRSYHVVFAVPIYHVANMEYFPVEIQFRTMSMDLWASMEHRVCYKKMLEQEDMVRRQEAFLQYAKTLQKMEEEIFGLTKPHKGLKQFLDK